MENEADAATVTKALLATLGAGIYMIIAAITAFVIFTRNTNEEIRRWATLITYSAFIALVATLASVLLVDLLFEVLIRFLKPEPAAVHFK